VSAAGPPTRVTDDDRRQTTPIDDSVQNNTGPLGGPVMIILIIMISIAIT